MKKVLQISSTLAWFPNCFLNTLHQPWFTTWSSWNNMG